MKPSTKYTPKFQEKEKRRTVITKKLQDNKKHKLNSNKEPVPTRPHNGSGPAFLVVRQQVGRLKGPKPAASQ